MTVKKPAKPRQPRKRTIAQNQNASGTSKKMQMYDLIGEKLRAYYDEVASEPVPDRFEQLLRELEAKSKSRGT
jgi:Anti-sigma factor NepR